MTKTALVVVDVQRDFCEGGALAAGNTLSLLEPLKRFIDEARSQGTLIVFTQDWHPANHSSFRENGGPWPVHCVAETPGAELMPPLRAEAGDVVIHKGVGVDGAGYSGFDATPLERELRGKGVTRVGVAGVATEYCVRATAMDARKAGFESAVLTDLIRAVQQKDVPKNLREMKEAGISEESSAEWLAGK
ncbi:MAG TPA: isochorismatase family protein [Candidatus Eisenbacteria bacterium]|nr:isochorismatase family protein [Candidatus Eisenbacteria bacterium]